MNIEHCDGKAACRHVDSGVFGAACRHDVLLKLADIVGCGEKLDFALA